MNLYYQMMAEAMREDDAPVYAFRITETYINDEAVGQQLGPDHLIRELDAGHGKTFYLYADGDTQGELEKYYKGRLVVADGDDWGNEEVVSAPLFQFGRGYSGCTVIKWHGHPEWEVG